MFVLIVSEKLKLNLEKTIKSINEFQPLEHRMEFVANIKSQLKCQKCGESKEYVLDFHHLNPDEKETTIARMTSNKYRIDKVLDEIRKCIVLCSNCHREFHYLEENYGSTIEEYLSDTYELEVC